MKKNLAIYYHGLASFILKLVWWMWYTRDIVEWMWIWQATTYLKRTNFREYVIYVNFGHIRKIKYKQNILCDQIREI